jgi:hypothetical protein
MFAYLPRLAVGAYVGRKRPGVARTTAVPDMQKRREDLRTRVVRAVEAALSRQHYSRLRGRRGCRRFWRVPPEPLSTVITFVLVGPELLQQKRFWPDERFESKNINTHVPPGWSCRALI